MTRRIIARKYLPSHYPVVGTVVLAMALDHWNASDVVRGIAWTIAALLWIVVVIDVVTATDSDPFEKK